MMITRCLGALLVLSFFAVAEASTTITVVAPPGASPGMAGSTVFTTGGSTLFAVGTGDRVNALAFDPLGNLYEADSGGKIYRITPQGVASEFTTVAVTGINNPTALAFDVNGNLFVSGSGNYTGRVAKVAADGLSSTSLLESNNPAYGMAFDVNGDLFVSSFGSILKIAPNGTTTTFATGTTGFGLAFDSAGALYQLRQFDYSIQKFATDGSSSTAYATGLEQGWDLAIDANDQFYYSSVISAFSYLVGPGDANKTDLTYPDIFPAYHLAIFSAPEPSRAALVLTALVLLGMRRRRRD